MCSDCNCGCPDSANCNCATFKNAASFAGKGKDYNASEMKKSPGRGVVPIGKRDGKAVGRR